MSVQALNRKEAIASGEDIAPVTREEYYLKELAEGQGGGGGLEYVIPEQTVTITDAPVEIQVTGTLQEEVYILKVVFPGPGGAFYGSLIKLPAPIVNTWIASAPDDLIFTIKYADNKYTLLIEQGDTTLSGTYPISAIRGF